MTNDAACSTVVRHIIISTSAALSSYRLREPRQSKSTAAAATSITNENKNKNNNNNDVTVPCKCTSTYYIYLYNIMGSHILWCTHVYFARILYNVIAVRARIRETVFQFFFFYIYFHS